MKKFNFKFVGFNLILNQKQKSKVTVYQRKYVNKVVDQLMFFCIYIIDVLF